jgi:dihydroorotate dehydrogenase electron transfer subunit
LPPLCKIQSFKANNATSLSFQPLKEEKYCQEKTFTMPNIIFNRKVAAHYYKMRIRCPAIACKAKPGQFVMVRVTEAFDPLLRRPLSIHRVCSGQDTAKTKKSPACIELLYRSVGKGTYILSKKQKGDSIDLTGPLGNGFSIDNNLQTAVLVAGGIGVAPLLSLAQKLKGSRGTNPVKTTLMALLGGKTSADILCRTDLRKLGAKVAVSTEDGSSGTKGLVTDLLTGFFEELSPVNRKGLCLYGCGPLPMLRALAEFADRQNLPCQVSLETRMACGVGACLGCSVPARSNGGRLPAFQRACKEGPVFDSSIVLWDDPHLSDPGG